MSSTAIILTVIFLAPILGGWLTYFLKRSIYSIIGVGVSFGCGVYLLAQNQEWSSRFEWLPGMDLGWRLDGISLVLIALVLFISLLVHIFSLGYMSEKDQPRYFLKLGFFTTAMLGLLAADHLILVFIFWELVGFASYLLIGFWYKKTEAAKSAKWAFITNRVADVALLAAFLALGNSHSFFLSELGAISSVWIGAGLLIGAMGKSAQFPFSAWLPRAMTGPTPVSALIHAATMVAAGVYLLVRVGAYLPIEIQNATAIIGALTAFFGATVAITQNDIKQVLAYSTVSQLGFMFLAIGAGAVESAFFHLWTHAFFKAGLFLAAGAVIHHLGTQDMRKMGGLKSSMKWVFYVHLICGLALAGIPLFSGFMSKEGILNAAWTWSNQLLLDGFSEAHLVFYFTFFTVALTALYIGRQVLLVYFGAQRETIQSTHGFKRQLIIPIAILAIASLWFFQNLNPLASQGWVQGLAGFDLTVGHSSGLMISSVLMAVLGLSASIFFYSPGRKYLVNYASLSVPQSMVGKFSFMGWYLDSLYAKVLEPGYLGVSKGLYWLDRNFIDGIVNALGVAGVIIAKLTALFDTYVIDGLVNFAAWLVKLIGGGVSRVQSGQLQHQLIWLIIGLIFILCAILFF